MMREMSAQAQVLHAIYDVNGAKVNGRRVKIDDFLPSKPPSDEEIEVRLMSFFANLKSK